LGGHRLAGRLVRVDRGPDGPVRRFGSGHGHLHCRGAGDRLTWSRWGRCGLRVPLCGPGLPLPLRRARGRCSRLLHLGRSLALAVALGLGLECVLCVRGWYRVAARQLARHLLTRTLRDRLSRHLTLGLLGLCLLSLRGLPLLGLGPLYLPLLGRLSLTLLSQLSLTLLSLSLLPLHLLRRCRRLRAARRPGPLPRPFRRQLNSCPRGVTGLVGVGCAVLAFLTGHRGARRRHRITGLPGGRIGRATGRGEGGVLLGGKRRGEPLIRATARGARRRTARRRDCGHHWSHHEGSTRRIVVGGVVISASLTFSPGYGAWIHLLPPA